MSHDTPKIDIRLGLNILEYARENSSDKKPYEEHIEFLRKQAIAPQPHVWTETWWFFQKVLDRRDVKDHYVGVEDHFNALIGGMKESKPPTSWRKPSEIPKPIDIVHGAQILMLTYPESVFWSQKQKLGAIGIWWGMELDFEMEKVWRDPIINREVRKISERVFDFLAEPKPLTLELSPRRVVNKLRKIFDSHKGHSRKLTYLDVLKELGSALGYYYGSLHNTFRLDNQLMKGIEALDKNIHSWIRSWRRFRLFKITPEGVAWAYRLLAKRHGRAMSKWSKARLIDEISTLIECNFNSLNSKLLKEPSLIREAIRLDPRLARLLPSPRRKEKRKPQYRRPGKWSKKIVIAPNHVVDAARVVYEAYGDETSRWTQARMHLEISALIGCSRRSLYQTLWADRVLVAEIKKQDPEAYDIMRVPRKGKNKKGGQPNPDDDPKPTGTDGDRSAASTDNGEPLPEPAAVIPDPSGITSYVETEVFPMVAAPLPATASLSGTAYVRSTTSIR